MTSLHSARSRLAQLRNKLHAELSALKSSSTKHKKTEGRLGGVMDAIQIVDEELLANEQGAPVLIGNYPSQMMTDAETRAANDADNAEYMARVLRPDQVAWLNARRGE